MNVVDRVELVEKQLDNLITKAELWQIIFDECPMAIACFDENMRFFMINDSFTTLTGFNKDELIGESIKYVLPQKFKKVHRKYEEQYIANPIKKVDRHGLAPEILNIHGDPIKIDINLSFIEYQNSMYYVAFIRRIK